MRTGLEEPFEANDLPVRLRVELDERVGEITAADRYHEPIVILVDALDTGAGVKYSDRHLPKERILRSPTEKSS